MVLEIAVVTHLKPLGIPKRGIATEVPTFGGTHEGAARPPARDTRVALLDLLGDTEDRPEKTNQRSGHSLDKAEKKKINTRKIVSAPDGMAGLAEEEEEMYIVRERERKMSGM